MNLTAKTKFTIFLVIYFTVVIVSELFYRNPLFNKSIPFEVDFQQKFPSDSFIGKFLSTVTELGDIAILLYLALIVACFVPYHKFLVLITVIFSGKYIGNLLKSIYGSPRPNWINKSDNQALNDYCKLSFANPSGHSVLSSSFFLSAWHLLTAQYIQKNKIWQQVLKWITFAFSVFMILCVMISRLYEGVHTINQIIFGCCIGVGNYLVYFHLLQIHTVSVKKFLDTIKKKIVIIIVVFGIAIVALLLVFFLIKHDDSEFIEMIKVHCSEDKRKKKHKVMEYDGLMDTLTIAGPIGMVCALMITNFIINKCFYQKENNIFDWISAGFKIRIVQTISFAVIYVGVYILTSFITDLIGHKTILISSLNSVFECFFPQLIISTVGIILPYMIMECIFGKQPPRSDGALLDMNTIGTEQDTVDAPLFKKDVVSESNDA